MQKLELKSRNLRDHVLNYVYYCLSDSTGLIKKAIDTYRKEYVKDTPLISLLFSKVNYGLFDLDYDVMAETWQVSKVVQIIITLGEFHYIIEYKKGIIKNNVYNNYTRKSII